MKNYLINNGRISFTEAVSLDVDDILKYLKREKLEHIKKLSRQQKRDEAAKTNEDNVIRRAKQKRIGNVERRKSDDDELSNNPLLSNYTSNTESDGAKEESSPIRKKKKIIKLSGKERQKLVQDIAAAEATFNSQVEERGAKLEIINTLTADINKLHVTINSCAKELRSMKMRLAATDDDQIDYELDTEIISNAKTIVVTRLSKVDDKSASYQKVQQL